MSNPTERIFELRELIKKYRDSYYNEDLSLVSDSEYDLLEKELRNLKLNTPNLPGAARLLRSGVRYPTLSIRLSI